MSETIILILNYILYVGEFLFDLYFMSCVFKLKMKQRYFLALAAIMLSSRILTNEIFLEGSAASLILMNVVYISFHIIPFFGNIWKRFGVTMLLFVMELTGEIATTVICNTLGLNYMGEERFYASIIAYMIYNTLMMIGVWIIFINKKWTKRISLFLLFPIYQAFAIVLYLMMRGAPLINRVLGGSLATVFNIWFVITVINVFRGMMERIEAEEHLDMLSKQMQYELQYYKNVERRTEELRDIRHDFLNQVQTSLLLLKSGEQNSTLENQRAFADKVSEAKRVLNDYRQGKWCANPVADAILYLKAEEAALQGIHFEADCELGRELAVENIDLCCILGNLLDNAIEANAGAAEDKKFISLQMSDTQGKLNITCRNYTKTEPKEKRGNWITDKKNRKAHGRGLHTMEKICAKYGGTLEKKCVENIVEITMEM